MKQSLTVNGRSITTDVDDPRMLLVDFLRGKLGGRSAGNDPETEAILREVLYLVLSTPESQLG